LIDIAITAPAQKLPRAGAAVSLKHPFMEFRSQPWSCRPAWPIAFAALLLLLAGGGCGSVAPGEKSGIFAAPSNLTATMPDLYNVHLQWTNHATAEGGNLVEFQMCPSGTHLPAKERDDFVILAFLNPAETTFHHEDLGAETVFTYRIRPYFGKASAPTEITTGSTAAAETEEPEGPLEEPETKSPATHLKSIRQPAGSGEGIPGDVAASLSAPTHVVLRWTDHAADADGYLVEVSSSPDTGYQVCALLPPHAASFRKTALPPETKLFFRVRAFFYGRPSNRVTQTTGPERMDGRQSTPAR
jgi:hypothetical protein